MRKFLESGAAQIGVRIQSIGVNFDPEVLSLPGGTAIAVILWLYASTMVALKRCAPRLRSGSRVHRIRRDRDTGNL